MDRLGEIWRRLLFIFRLRHFDHDLEEEMQFHLDMKARQNREAGLDAEEAIYAARRRFGNATLLMEASREMWGCRWLRELAQDVAYALRTMRRTPGFTAIAVSTLALGIGINTAFFSFVDAALLKPLGYREPDRLVNILGPDRRQMSGSLSAVLTWQRENRAFTRLAARLLFETNINLSGPSLEFAQRVSTVRVTANYFDVLGVTPRLGRTFLPEEEEPGKERVCILSSALWQSSFGADPDALGKPAYLDGYKYDIIGVLPPGILDATEIWLPLPFTQENLKGDMWIGLLGRLKPNVTREQARDEMTRVFSFTPQHEKWTATIVPLRNWMVLAKTRMILLLLWAASAFVLLIACANLANLILARGLARRREVAIRLSLGAGRWRVVRQFLTENLLLSALGGTLGVLVSVWLIGVLRAIEPAYLMPPGMPVTLDSRLLYFGLGLSLANGLVFGLPPAWRQTANPGRTRRRGPAHLLLVGEVALAFVLAVAAALSIRSFVRLLGVGVGLRATNVLTWQVHLPQSRYPGGREIRAYHDEFLARLPAPAAVSNRLPLGGSSFDAPLMVDGKTRGGAMFWTVSPEYFRLMGLRLLKGRWLSVFDTSAARRVVVINDTFAHRYFAVRDPLGALINSHWTEPAAIIGVVGAVKFQGVAEESRPEIYLPVAQLSAKMLEQFMQRSVFLTTGLPGGETAVRAIAAGIDREVPVFALKTVDRVLSDAVGTPRFQTWIFTGFGAVALLLTAIGIYGVISYSVSQRTQEIGVRIALGAEKRAVLGLILRRGLGLAAAGVLLGLAGELALGRALASYLFGITPYDPATLSGVTAVILLTALLACWLPARRASRVDPMEALRYE